MKRFFCLCLCLFVVYGCSRPSEEQGEKTASKRTLIQNKGSDTLVNVAQAWAEEYAEINSNVAIAVSGGGSGTGISAMINGTVDIANASRKMKDKEVAAAQKNRIEPVEHIVGYDALAVYIHQDNPMTEGTLVQLAAMVLMRDVVRGGFLADHYRPADFPVQTQVLNLVLFAGLLVAAVGVIFWMVRLLYRHRAAGRS